ncbi:MAG: alpha-glucan family phosphorylase, partial [SAR202 cluster bacterium]|nr:alpha-glucan family phosphorylase [SAR202 cluster bacterium]
WEELGLEKRALLSLGKWDHDGDAFNMTALAFRTAAARNAVSKLHAQVSQRIWHSLWTESAGERAPVSHVTNGVHLPSWLAPELADLLDRYLGNEWLEHQDDAEVWDRVEAMPDDELWAVHLQLKRRLFDYLRQRSSEAWVAGMPPEQLASTGLLLDPEALTICFARRFTEYKRPFLVLHDVPRLQRILNDTRRPVQLVFAGKAHPADFPSKHLIHQIYSRAVDRTFRGRIAFVQDYDLELASHLVRGADVWLNTPRRLHEASGTSGMKAALNGVLHLSTPDGWWHEGYNGANGWSIGDDGERVDPAEEDRADAESLYSLLENQVVPLFYDRDRDGVPHGWIRIMKESVRSIAPAFSARRMLRRYVEAMYTWVPQAGSATNPTPVETALGH